MSIDQYFENVSRAIMAFQFLEATLKFYILDCDRMIQKAIKNSFHYSVREKGIDKMPLGRLIEEFSKRSNRHDIISCLKKLNRHRNQIAHTAYLLTCEELEESETIRGYSQKTDEVRKAVRACMKELFREYSRITNKHFPEEILKQI